MDRSTLIFKGSRLSSEATLKFIHDALQEMRLEYQSKSNIKKKAGYFEIILRAAWYNKLE